MTRHAHSYRIQGHSMNRYSGVEPTERDMAAPQQQARYHCERGCVHSPFTVPLAAEVEPQAAWTCRCGGTGRLDSAPAGAMPDYSDYSQGTRTSKGSGQYKDMRPVALMWERRMAKDGGGRQLLEETLAWALARIRGEAS